MAHIITDKRIPDRQTCVVRYALERRAKATPDREFMSFEDGSSWTYAAADMQAHRISTGLHRLGVKQGDHVACWLPNGREAIEVWLGASYLGAVFVPINTAYRGRQLEHILNLSDARIAVIHNEFVPRLKGLNLNTLQSVVVIDTAPKENDAFELHGYDTLCGSSESLSPERTIEPWDPAHIIFTSGTTGPSKAVLSSYIHGWTQNAEPFAFVGEDDRFLLTLPLCHVSGMGILYIALANGCAVAMAGPFKTDEFWDTIRRTQSTVCIVLGVMTQFLLKQPTAPSDKTHGLKIGLMVPWGDDALEFAERFGVDLYTCFNMTEIANPIVSTVNPQQPGTAGQKRDGFDLRIVDEHDCEVPIGEVGELILRADRPWALNSGYYDNPQATADAWRNGWFHTGDAFRMDTEGYYYFVDRKKDAIRRRGENISSFEVESEVLMHPAVREAAAVAVPSEYSEDEVLVCVSVVEGRSLEAAELIEFLSPRMTSFMVPRYVRIMPDLPKTQTQKIIKHVLRDEGVTADTWDRHA